MRTAILYHKLIPLAVSNKSCQIRSTVEHENSGLVTANPRRPRTPCYNNIEIVLREIGDGGCLRGVDYEEWRPIWFTTKKETCRRWRSEPDAFQ